MGGAGAGTTARDLVLFYAGLTRQRLDRAAEARESYQRLLTGSPTSPLAAVSRRLSDYLDLRARLNRRVRVELSTRLQYDDNLVLVPDTNVFNLHSREKSTPAELFQLGTQFVLHRRGGSEIAAGYAFSQALTNALPTAGVRDHIVTVGRTHHDMLAALPFSVGVDYGHDGLSIGGAPFLRRQRVRPTFAIHLGRRHATTAQYDVQWKAFHDEPVTAEDDRDALTHEAGVLHVVRLLGGRYRIAGGLFGESERAAGDDWDHSSRTVVVGTQYSSLSGISVGLDYTHTRPIYQHSNSFFWTIRDDTGRVLTVHMSKALGNGFVVDVQYARQRNTSSIPLFQYTKNLVSGGVTWRS